MRFAFIYHPVQFYLVTILATFIPGFVAAYVSYRDKIDKMQPLLIITIFVPCITALTMIFLSGNKEMIQDFLTRLMLFKIHLKYLSVILLLMPCVILVATALSLVFGYSAEQFCFNTELNVIKGWGFIGIFIPLLLAPLIEELGWRGYGVDSLRSHFNLFTTSLLFGSLWALWHLPLFFIKGYYHNQLCALGPLYVVNFFVSVFVMAFLMNWIYYQTDRSIPAVILFHAIINLSSMLLKTDPFTKCIATGLLCVVLIIVLIQNKTFFFHDDTRPATQIDGVSWRNGQQGSIIRGNISAKDRSNNHTQVLNQLLQHELDLLRTQYSFPGATMSYVLSNGETGTVVTGLADIEKKQPMTTECRMLAASIGKTFVAATTLALAKEGVLTLDDPLSKWLGDKHWYSRLPNGKNITLRHLLTHSAGLPDHVETKDFVQLFSFNNFQENHTCIPELLVGFILNQPPLFEAGKGWHYTDTGYILLGLVIEKATGNNYYNEVDRRFLKPLNLYQTVPSDHREIPFLVAGYTTENNLFHLPRKTVDNEGIMVWNPAIEWTGGGLLMSSADLARWAKMLYEGKAMSFDYFDDLFSSVSTHNEETKISYGLGVAIEEKEPLGIRYGHGGVIPGYTSSMRYYPQHGVAVAFQINADWGMAHQSTKLVSHMEQALAEIVIHQKETRDITT